MARATYLRVLPRIGGTLTPPWTQAQIESLCDSADYEINAYTNPAAISLTSNEAIEIAVDVVLGLKILADGHQSRTGTISHDGRTYSDADPLSPGIKERIDKLLASETTSYTSFGIITQIE
jgi:hypothetical protein